jgi:hypothetical protein
VKAFLAICVLLLVVTFAVCDYHQRRECEENGGRVERYNCHTVIHCTHTGKTSTCYPQEHCDWRCVDLPAERR